MRTGPYTLLRDFAQKHPNTRSALDHWYELISGRNFGSILVLIEGYDHAHNPELAARIQSARAEHASNTENELVVD